MVTQTKSRKGKKRSNRLRTQAAPRLESLEDRRLMTADTVGVQAELPVVVDDLAAMVLASDPQLVQEFQTADTNEVFERTAELQLVNPDAWSGIIDQSEICDFGQLLASSSESNTALTDLVVLEFIDIPNEEAIAAELVDLLAMELQEQDSQSSELPPQFEQLRQELGDEAFADWLTSNLEQFGSLQGVSREEFEQAASELGEEAVQEFTEVEEALQDWLTESQEVNVTISGKQSDVWQIEGYDLSADNATTKALPWTNLNTIEIELGGNQEFDGSELQLFGNRSSADGVELAVPLTFLGQHGNVGSWAFSDLVDGYYVANVQGNSPISFSVLGGNSSGNGTSAGVVDFGDFSFFAATFGETSDTANPNGSDFNGDGVVGFADFAQFAVKFGDRLPDLGIAPEAWVAESLIDCVGCSPVINVLPFMPLGNLDPNPPAQQVDPQLVEGERIKLNLLKSDGMVKPDGSFVVTKQVFVSSNDKFRVVRTVEEVEQGPPGDKAKVTKTTTHIKKKGDPAGEFTEITEREYKDDLKNRKGEVIKPKGTKTSYESDPSKPNVTYQETRPDGSGHKTVTPKNVLNGEGTTRTVFGAGGGVKEVHVFTGGKWQQTK